MHYLERLRIAVNKFWNKAALNNINGESFTYGDMATSIEKLHIAFEKAGIKKGDKVAIAARNGARWGMAYLAVNTYEAVAVPILADFTPESTCFLVNHSDSIALFTTADKWEKLNLAEMPKIKLVFDAETFEILWCADESFKQFYAGIDDVMARKYPGGFSARDVNYPTDNLDKLSTINYTSGSTGDPKGVMLTYGNFSSMIDYCQRHVEANEKYNMVSMLPMAHMYGLVIEFIYPLCNGTAVYWLGKAPTPATLISAFKQVKPYLLITVPLVMEKIFKAKIKPVLDKPAIRILTRIPGINTIIFNKIRKSLTDAFGGNIQEFIMGGAPVNPDIEKWFRKIKLPYLVGYGMTEATPLLAYEHYSKYVPGSCGKAVDTATVRIDSPDPENIPGEIQAKGSNICIGYYKNPEATANAFTEDGFLKTGDLGVMDKEGNIFIRGRIKNMILGPSGQNIYPEEIESVVCNQDYVLESVVVDRKGKLVALVFPDYNKMREDGAKNDDVMNTIIKGSNKRLPSYSHISKVEFVDNPFEKTPKMSIKRFLYK